MAEARSAVSELRVDRLEEGRSPKYDFLIALRSSLIRRFFRTRNLIKNGMWPTSLWNLGLLVFVLSILLVGDWQFAKSLTDRLHILQDVLYIPKDWPIAIRSLIVSVVSGFIFFLILLHVRRYLLRMLLSYRGWMYEQPKTQGLTTKIWGLAVKLMSGSHPSLYGCQLSLPRLPVPSLKKTLKGLIQSLKPLYGEHSEMIQELKKESKEFQRTLGPKLQRILYLKSWWSQNYVTDFWEKYVYLMNRSPLPVNSNYYIMDQGVTCPTSNQVARAASMVYQMLLVKQRLDREQIEPLLIRNVIPICMGQYSRCFSTVRVPGVDVDKLVHYDSSQSKHVVVFRKGIYYRLDVYDKNRKLLTPVNLQKQLTWIMEDAEKFQDAVSEEEKSLAALTGMDRKSWAQVRERYFTTGINSESISVIEKSLMCLVLGTKVNTDFSSRGRYIMHADGKSIWFDKSITIVVSPDGRMGLHCEHSFADAPVVAHVMEYNLTEEAKLMIALENDPSAVSNSKVLVGIVDSSENCNTLPEDNEISIHYPPQRLEWDVSPDLCPHVTRAVSITQQAIDDVDLHIAEYPYYGKGFVKTCKVSPDAYLQMALQITYYKIAGKHPLTYESSMTRLYLMGRTETVRSLTLEAVDFVKAFVDKSVDRDEKIRLLRRACDHHAKLYKDAMNGKGIDRHLFALFVISKGLDYDCEFLKKCLSMPWVLSTSQAPQQQILSSPNCDMEQFRDKISPGGGFGPVSDDGYGVSYMIAGNYRIYFHVSSKKSSKSTDSMLFVNQLFNTLDELKALFEGKS